MSWKNCNKVLLIQRRGRVVADYKNRKKVSLVHYNSYPLVKVAPKSMVQVISTLFKLQVKFQLEEVLGIILTNQKLSWDFRNYIFAKFKRIL